MTGIDEWIIRLSAKDLTRLFAKFSQAADFSTVQDCRIHDVIMEALKAARK